MEDLFNDNKKDKDIHRVSSHVDTAEGMVRKRKESMDEFKATVKNVFKDWDGEPLAIVRIKEDENYYPTSSHCVIVGCSRRESQVKLARALSETADNINEELGKFKKHTKSTEELLDLLNKLMEDE